MALQGTVESFPVIEVVRLLSDGGHTGRLSVDGDRGSALLWVSAGSLLGGELGGIPQFDPVRLVTEALRNRNGTFVFDVVPIDASAASGMAESPLDGVLVEAEARLAEWSAIELVIPSVAHRLRLSSALPVESVTLDRQQWALVVSAAHWPEVRESATELGMDELTACRMAAGMVETGLLVVEDPSGGSALTTSSVDDSHQDRAAAFLADLPYDESTPVAHPGVDVGLAVDPELDADVHVLDVSGVTAPATTDEFAGHFPIDDLIGSGPDDDWGDMSEPAPPAAPDPFSLGIEPLAPADLGGVDDLDRLVGAAPSHEPAAPLFAGLPDLDDSGQRISPGLSRLGSGPVDEAELQRQMADLSPRAAEAIAAALESLPDDPTM